MNEHAQYFRNSRGQRLFGVLNSPADVSGSQVGAVFCHPIGEEKQKSYRAYAQFGRYLAAAGTPCLRFDCYGFGDSDGDAVEATVESQVTDARAGIDLLRQSTGVSSVVLLGARLGATVAALAAEGAADVVGIGLFSPIIDGAQYWNQLVRTQQMSYMTRGAKPKKRNELIEDLDAVGYLEIDANYLSAEFVEQLKAIDLRNSASRFAGRCLVTALASDDANSARTAELAHRYRQGGAVVSQYLAEQRDFWTSQALYAAHLPFDLYDRTTMWLEETRA